MLALGVLIPVTNRRLFINSIYVFQLNIFRNHIRPVPDDVKQRLAMSSQEMTAELELEGERIREEKQQSSVTENEEQFKGPRFYPPVYRRRYAAVCELVKKHQAKRVRYMFNIL